MKKKDIDNNAAATQEDLELWGGNLAFQIEEARQENKEQFQKINGHSQKNDGRLNMIDGRLDKHEVILEKLVDTVQELKKSVDLNTEATSMLTQEMREIKNLEFQVYNHENRITELEKR